MADNKGFSVAKWINAHPKDIDIIRRKRNKGDRKNDAKVELRKKGL